MPSHSDHSSLITSCFRPLLYPLYYTPSIFKICHLLFFAPRMSHIQSWLCFILIIHNIYVQGCQLFHYSGRHFPPILLSFQNSLSSRSYILCFPPPKFCHFFFLEKHFPLLHIHVELPFNSLPQSTYPQGTQGSLNVHPLLLVFEKKQSSFFPPVLELLAIY